MMMLTYNVLNSSQHQSIYGLSLTMIIHGTGSDDNVEMIKHCFGKTSSRDHFRLARKSKIIFTE